jgi:hypothetical protein
MMGMPLQFEANHGQVDAQVKFMARGKGYTLFLTPTESVMVLQQREATAEKDALKVNNPASLPEPAPIKQAVVRMKLEGATPSPVIDGMEQLPGIVNYFIGNDPAKWHTKIPTYAKVQYQEVYPGIGLAYYGNQGRLEYDFIVAPGADPDQIKLAFEGASDVKIADSGDLLLATALGEVRLQQPVIYQLEASGHKTLVAGHYVLGRPAISQHSSQSAHYEVGFTLASYDQTKPIIIDPVLLYSTYLGGNIDDVGNGIAVDGTGHVYVTGQSNSTTFPQVGPTYAGGVGGISAFVTKFNAAGTSLLYSTFLGGSNSDFGKGIAVDGAGQAYVTGFTLSADFPIAAPIQATTGGVEDAFVTKLSATGSSLLYSTYLGGSHIDHGQGIAVDGLMQAYVTGYSSSTNFPTFNAVQATIGSVQQDAFVTKLNAAGTSFVYSTYLGGNGPDDGLGIAVDGAGQAYVTGSAAGTFPTVNAAQATSGGGGDAFVTKLSAGGGFVYSTFLGGSGGDTGLGIAVDGAGQAYVTGWTFGNFPTVNAVQATFGSGVRDAFVTKLSAAGNSLVYSTYLGGSHLDEGNGIGVDGAGQAYVTGATASTNFPTATPIQAANGGGGNWDVFVTKLNAGGTSFLYSTYLGGTLEDRGLGIAVDGAGRAYVTGSAQSQNFPTANAFQATKSIFSGRSAFVTKIVDKPTANAGPDQSVPEGTLVTLDGTGSTGSSLTYSWTRMAGPVVTLGGATSEHPTFSAPGVPPAGDTVTFELVVCEGSSNCSDPDSVNVHITDVNHPPVADAGSDQTVQEGSSVQLNGTGSYDPDVELLTYQWSQILGPAVTLQGDTIAQPTFVAPTVGSAGATLVFDLTVKDPHNLTGPDSVSIHVSNINQSPVANAGPDQTVNENSAVALNGTGSSDPDLDTLHFTWTQTGGPPVTLTGNTVANPAFTTPLVGAGGAILTFQLVVSDGQASSAADTVDIHVQDLNAPLACELAQPSVASLWPPHHTMVPVSIMGVTDPNNQAVTFAYPTVTQDEPTSGLGGGDTSPDAAVSGNQILLRAERDKSIDGRVYVVHFTATDGQGGSCNGTVKVIVPYHGKKGSAVEGPQLYNSFAP